MRTAENRGGERVLYTFGVEPDEAVRMAAAIREYARNSEYAYTKEERQDMPDESMQVYVLGENSIVVASRAYVGSVGEKARREAREVAEYAYALLEDSGLLRQ